MQVTLDIKPEISARLNQAAEDRGLNPATLLENLVTEYLPPVKNEAKPKISAKSVAVIALLDEWLADAPTSPEEITRAQSEFDALMHNLNRNRLESGESPLL